MGTCDDEEADDVVDVGIGDCIAVATNGDAEATPPFLSQGFGGETIVAVEKERQRMSTERDRHWIMSR
jgi:hypothetical protein